MPAMNRRSFLKAASAGAAALGLTRLARPAEADAGKPNTILIMADKRPDA